MRTKSKNDSPSVFVRSSAYKVDLSDAIERYRSSDALPTAGITFLGSQDEFEQLSSFPTKRPYLERYCSSLGLLLRSGLYQESNIFVLKSPTHIAEKADIERILSARSEKKIKVVALPESTPNDWACSLDSAIEEIELWAAKKSITNDIMERSSMLAKDDNQNSDSREKTFSADLRKKPAKEDLSEEEFKDLIARRLNDHLDSSPENILSKAIEVIKH